MFDAKALWIYSGVFGFLLAAGLGLPVPEEVPIVTAGGAVAHYGPGHEDTHLFWWIMLPLCILGVVIGDGFLYGIGWFWGPSLLEKPWVARLIPPAKQKRIQANFRKHGILVLLFARFLPGIRSPIFITAGIMRLSFARFLLADGLYAIPGVSLLFFLSMWFYDQTKELLDRWEKLRPLVIVVLILAIGGFLLYRFVRKPMATGDPEDLPIIGPEVAAAVEQPPTPAARTNE